MPTIDDRIAELESVKAVAEAELRVLTSTSAGDVREFVKQTTASGQLPDGTSITAIAQIVDLWEQFKRGAVRGPQA